MLATKFDIYESILFLSVFESCPWKYNQLAFNVVSFKLWINYLGSITNCDDVWLNKIVTSKGL